MEYRGKYSIINLQNIKTYPVSTRKNKVSIENLVDINKIATEKILLNNDVEALIEEVSEIFFDFIQKGKPIFVISGAHLVKNGLGPIIIDLMKRGFISLYATNMACAIHDFELAMIGKTSEDVPNALPEGNFGMAYELGFINQAILLGNKQKLGLGESIGKMINDQIFCKEALLGFSENIPDFKYKDFSVFSTGYRLNIPVTIHATIGNDVIDQHPNFDGEAKGGTSGRDFLIFTENMKKLVNGGLILNIGSAIIGPELLLKALSITSNLGCKANGLITADFDLRPVDLSKMKSEDNYHYYFRDQKSIVTRIPQSFGGKGYYICGNHLFTIKKFYQLLTKKFGW